MDLLDNKPYQPTKFRRKNWVEKNDVSRETYNKDNQIGLKTSIFMSILCG